MSNDNRSSESSSAATSPSVPLPKGKSLSEADYLKEQSANAKAAIANVIKGIQASVAQGVDPRAITGEHPWIAMGAAAVAGFAAAATLVPSKEQQALNRLAAIERAMAPQPRETVTVDDDGRVRPAGQTMMSKVFHELLNVVKPALMSAITAGIASKTAADSAKENGDGSSHSDSPGPGGSPS